MNSTANKVGRYCDYPNAANSFVLLTMLYVSVVTVMFSLAVLVLFLEVSNKIGSYRYCEFANIAKASNSSNV